MPPVRGPWKKGRGASVGAERPSVEPACRAGRQLPDGGTTLTRQRSDLAVAAGPCAFTETTGNVKGGRSQWQRNRVRGPSSKTGSPGDGRDQTTCLKRRRGRQALRSPEQSVLERPEVRPVCPVHRCPSGQRGPWWGGKKKLSCSAEFSRDPPPAVKGISRKQASRRDLFEIQ